VPNSLGVDLGTTFVAAAITRPQGVEMVSLTPHSAVAPALVHLDENGTVSTGEAARRRAVTEPDRVGREFKRRLGDLTPMMLGDESFAVTDLLGVLLRDVLCHVTRVEREPPEQVVLTHPANWGPFRRALFEEVPANAELSNTLTITEPTAAAAHYAAARRLHDGQIVAVYDLGGGTFDATILRGGPDGVQILGRPEGIERLGGADFDRSVLEYVNYSTGGALDALDMTDPHTARAVARLRQDCVLAKESLSFDTEATIPVFLPDRHFEVTLTRSEFEGMVRGSLESTTQALVRALRSARLEPSDLSAVLLVGGSSRIPLVADLVSRELGCRTLVEPYPKFTVALGAAAAAAATSGRAQQSVVVEPVLPPERDLPADSPPAQLAPPNAQNWILALCVATIVLVAILVFVLRPGTGTASSTAPPLSTPKAAVAAVTTPAAAPAASVGNPTVAGAISVAAGPQAGAITPDGRFAYVTSTDTHSITVIEMATNAVVGSIPIGAGPPQYVAFTPDGRYAYVSVYDEIRNTGNAVVVVDTSTRAVVASIPAEKFPYALAVSPDGRQVYVPNHDVNLISVVDTATNTVVRKIAVKPNPHAVAYSVDGRRAYVANHVSNVVTVLDTSNSAILAEIRVGHSPHSIAVSPDRARVYVVNYDGNSTSVIDPATNTVTATIPVQEEPQSVAFAPDSRHAYVVNDGSNTVSVIDTATNQVTATIGVGQDPTNVFVAPNGRHAYVTNISSNNVTVLNTAR
jgi:YVTN family beta-propeller protein